MPIRPATADAIAAAAAALREGRLVAFPTETVYGLGADATNARAVASIFEAKGRPRFNPLITHIASTEEAARLVMMDARAQALAAAFWPGALTLVLRKRPDCAIADLATAGLETVALRVPSHPVAQALIRAAARPIAAPSANRSGHVSPTTAAHVEADLGDKVAIILDGGPCPIGVESTVVDVSGPEAVLLRAGGVTRAAVEAVLGAPLALHKEEAGRPTSPGQLASHYAPRAAVRLNATSVRAGEALLAFGPAVPPHDGPMVNLSPTGDLVEAAANLFAALRELDASGAPTIAVMRVPVQGLGEAINDRLRRAAVR
ncbi:MAG: L-threonylcarbamoyladenylate synthase [Hyphomicrobiaceae bacterium]